MIMMTQAAAQKLNELIAEHPDDPVVRLAITDLDEARLVFSITLESEPRSDDEVQACGGLTVAIAADSARRMEGSTLDYLDGQGFKFLHPVEPEPPKLDLFNLN